MLRADPVTEEKGTAMRWAQSEKISADETRSNLLSASAVAFMNALISVPRGACRRGACRTREEPRETPRQTALTALVRPDVEPFSVQASILGLHTGDSKLRADRALGIEDGVADESPRRL